jgi:hypothetical protein
VSCDNTGGTSWTTKADMLPHADMTSFSKTGYHVGAGLDTIILVSAQAWGCADCLTSFYASILSRATQTVLVFLTVLSTGLQYLVRHMNYKRDLARIEHIISQAKLVAWGPKMLPVGGRRKVGLLYQFPECPIPTGD